MSKRANWLLSPSHSRGQCVVAEESRPTAPTARGGIVTWSTARIRAAVSSPTTKSGRVRLVPVPGGTLVLPLSGEGQAPVRSGGATETVAARRRTRRRRRGPRRSPARPSPGTRPRRPGSTGRSASICWAAWISGIWSDPTTAPPTAMSSAIRRRAERFFGLGPCRGLFGPVRVSHRRVAGLEVAAPGLLDLDRLEQGLEVADAEAARRRGAR